MRKVALALAAATVVAAAAGCGESRQTAVAHVGGTTITREQLEQAVEHFQEEAKNEGKVFTPGAAATRKQLLGLLVYRTRLEEGAAALGVTVSDDAVARRLASSGGGEAEDTNGRALAESSVRAQLIVEAVYAKLAGRVHMTNPRRAAAARNAALNRWLASLAQRFPVR